MKLIKRLLLTFIALTAIFIVAVFFITANLNPNDYKQVIQDAAEREVGRKLHLEGDIKLTLFPTLSLDLERVSLDNPPGFEGRFASIERIRAELDLLPLLKKRLEIGKIILQKPHLTLDTLSDGRRNWEGLTEKSTAAAADQPSGTPSDARFDSPPAIAGLSLAGLTVKDATVIWRDARTQEHIQANTVTLEAGALASGKMTEFSLSGTVSDKRRQLSADISVDADMLLDLKNQHMDMQNLSAKVKLHEATAKPLNINVNTDAAIDLVQNTAQFKRLIVTVNDARVESAVSIDGLLSDQPKISAQLKSNEFDLRAWADALDLPLPQMVDDQVLHKFSVSGDVIVNLGTGQNRAVIRQSDVTLDDSRIRVQGQITWLPALRMTLDAEIDHVNVGRYLPPAEAGKNTAIKNIPINDLRTRISVENDKVDVAVPTVKVFGGHFDGALSMNPNTATDKRQATWRSSGKASGIKLEQLLDTLELADKKQLKGLGDLSYKLTATGNNEKALTQSLAGSIKLNIKKGSFKNSKLAHNIERVIAFLEKRPSAKAGEELLFNDIDASFSLNKGIADNRDLEVDMPLLKMRGAGRIDLPRSRVDYQLRVGLHGGETDEDPDEKIYIPIKISGALDDPKYSVDIEKFLLKESRQQLKRKLEKEKKQLKKKLKKKEEDIRERAKEKLNQILKGTLKLPF